MNALSARSSGAPGSEYELDKQLARDDDLNVRIDLARRGDVRPEVLYFLAVDSDIEIRREITRNAATPAQADLVLTGDGDEDVWCRIAHKVGHLTPDLSEQDVSQLGSMITETLAVLANDQLVQVRQILAEALAETDTVDQAVMERLARDDADVVALLVFERSPLLNDTFMVELIEAGPMSSRLKAISRRVGLNGDVADAIVGTDEESAITALLTNTSAQIREEILDALIDGGMGRKFVNHSNPNGMVAVVWKAGFDMPVAVFLQARLARVEPEEFLAAAVGGGFPLSEDQMAWQL